MVFFSELFGKPVYTEDQICHGVLRDLYFLNSDTPKVTRVAVEHASHAKTVIPITRIRCSTDRITVTRAGALTQHPNELSVTKTLLDQQIIDLVGNKVVRVNDVILQDQPQLTISGIDIGLLGIFRRIGLARIVQQLTGILHIPLSAQILSWGDIMNLELEHGQIQVREREEKLSKIHEEDLADYLEMTNIQNAHTFISTLKPKKAAEVVESLTVNYQVEIFQRFHPSKSAQLITLIDPDEAVDILLALDRSERDKITRLLPTEKQEELHRLMTFSRTPVGKRMTSEYFSVPSNYTIREILKEIKKQTEEFSSLGVIYILNREDQLVGVMSPHELLLQNPDTPAYKCMIPEPIVVLLTTPIEVVMYKLLKYNISALPVINRDKKILGIITIDDISDLILKKMQ